MPRNAARRGEIARQELTKGRCLSLRERSVCFCLAIWSGAMLLGVTFHVATATADESKEVKRAPLTMAFVELNRSDVGAILEAELLQKTDITWVERNDISKVIDEQGLQAMFAPEGVKERVRFGKLLKADLLALVRSGSLSSAGEKQATNYIEVTVADVARGLRLTHRRIVASNDPQADARQLVKDVEAGIVKQSRPIDFLFAVPPFVSDDLTHEHDELRSVYARLVESQLMEQPNTLVVELAEAEAIMNELRVTEPDDPKVDQNKVERMLPHYVVGRYRNEGKGKDERVAIQLALKHGTTGLYQADRQSKTEDAAVVLRDEVASFFKRLTGRTATLPEPAVEAKQLLQVAAEHLKLGAYEEAASLAEASILLQPKQIEPHVTAVRALTPLLRRHWQHRVYTRHEVRLAMSIYFRGLNHVTRFHQSGGDSSKYQAVGGGSFLSDFFSVAGGFGVHPHSSEDVKQHMAEFQARNRDMLMETIEAVIENSPDLASFYMNRGLAGLTAVEVREHQRKLIFKYQDRPNARAITRALCRRGYAIDVLNSPDERTLLETLEQQGNDAVKAEVAALRMAAETIAADQERQRMARSKINDEIEPVPKGKDRVVFSPVALKAADSNGRTHHVSSIQGVLATGAGFDVVWLKNAIYVMREKGTLEPLFVSDVPNSRFSIVNSYHEHSNICFDGKYVWATCYAPQQATRLLVINPETKHVAEITAAQGLPNPTESTGQTPQSFNLMSLAPISPGKVFVAGSFDRAWLAEVEFHSKSGGKVRVFHEAKETSDTSNREQWRSTALSFRPADVFALGSSSDEPGDLKRFLIGRASTNVAAFDRPLIVDPKTSTVEISTEKIWSNRRTLDQSAANGSLYWVHVAPPKNDTLALFCMNGKTMKVEMVASLPQEGHVLAEPHRVHVVGKQWWIVDLASKAVTPAGPVPWRFRPRLSTSGPRPLAEDARTQPFLQTIVRSNHYGILAYYSAGDRSNDKSLLQVTFAK